MILTVRSFAAFLIILAAGLPRAAFAVVVPEPPPPPPGPQTAQQVINVLNNFVPWLFGLLLTLAVLFLVIAAWNYLMAGEDTEKANTARRMILYTVFAIAAAALSRAVPELIESVTGISANTPGNQVNVATVADRITNWLFGLLIVVSVAFIVYAAFLFLGSGGSEEKVQKARRAVFYGVAAIAVAALAKAIVAIVQALLGVGTS